MLNLSLEPDIDRLSALYRYGLTEGERDPFVAAVLDKISTGFGGMTAQMVLVDDHKLWISASSGPPLDERGRQGSLAAEAIEQVEPLVVDDLTREPRFAQSPSVQSSPFLRAYAAVTLRTPENYAIGVLAVSDQTARSFREEHVVLLQRGAARIMERLEARRLARLDPSTGALDEAAFRAQVRSLSAVAARHKRDLSVLAVDVRSLRALLQSFHSDLGRLVVDRVGGLGRYRVRRLDSFGRLGEGTFAVLLPNTDEAGARSLGRRVVEGLAEGWQCPPESGLAAVPACVGVATFRPGVDDAGDLVTRAARDCRRLWSGDPSRQGMAPRVA